MSFALRTFTTGMTCVPTMRKKLMNESRQVLFEIVGLAAPGGGGAGRKSARSILCGPAPLSFRDFFSRIGRFWAAVSNRWA